jgi:hypothetical protein
MGPSTGGGEGVGVGREGCDTFAEEDVSSSVWSNRDIVWQITEPLHFHQHANNRHMVCGEGDK